MTFVILFCNSFISSSWSFPSCQSGRGHQLGPFGVVIRSYLTAALCILARAICTSANENFSVRCCLQSSYVRRLLFVLNCIDRTITSQFLVPMIFYRIVHFQLNMFDGLLMAL